jgi:ribosomal protein L11 methyltransferase
MTYPALDVSGADADLVLAIVDDFSPSAVEDLASGGISIFFTAVSKRDAAQAAVATAFPSATLTPRLVDDEDWARRSQQALTAVTVGRVTVTPPWCEEATAFREATSGRTSDGPITIVITPSMGFGTGHHVTTRLCLAALQTLDLSRARVLDVGTGSGVLAIAAALLGAPASLGIDFDDDAITSARENLDINPDASNVTFQTIDVRDAPLAPADVVLANLTGATIVQSAGMLTSAVAAGGSLILSGVQEHEENEVLAAFAPATPTWVRKDLGWVGIMFNDWMRTQV